jgi:hypothetical protein
MRDLVNSIIAKKFDEANSILEENFELIMRMKLLEMKKMMGAKTVSEEVIEEEELDEARFKIVKARIRGGKIQRRRKVSNVPGMTFRGGQLKRMSPTERRRRKMGQRRGKIKRKAKLSRALMKRKRSMMKRRSIGLR